MLSSNVIELVLRQPVETGDFPMLETIPDFSGFSRDEKFKNSPLG